MSHFAFPQHEWPAVFEAAVWAGGAVHADPRTACVYALWGDDCKPLGLVAARALGP